MYYRICTCKGGENEDDMQEAVKVRMALGRRWSFAWHSGDGEVSDGIRETMKFRMMCIRRWSCLWRAWDGEVADDVQNVEADDREKTDDTDDMFRVSGWHAEDGDHAGDGEVADNMQETVKLQMTCRRQCSHGWLTRDCLHSVNKLLCIVLTNCGNKCFPMFFKSFQVIVCCHAAQYRPACMGVDEMYCNLMEAYSSQRNNILVYRNIYLVVSRSI